jgi:hypothetical protein
MSQKVTPNFIDRLITFVSPRTGLRRMAAREMLAVYGSYVGARVDRRETMGWMPRAGNADADSLLDLRFLRARSRDLMRNAPLASGAVSTVVENAAGTGLALLPGHEKLIGTLKFDGKTSGPEAALQIVTAEKALRAKQLDSVRSDGPKPVPESSGSAAADAATANPDPKAAKVDPKVTAERARELVAKAKVEGRKLTYAAAVSQVLTAK